MVLHDREHDLVALADVMDTERRRDEIDRLRRVAGEDDLFVRGGVEEGANALARDFEGFGRGIGQIVQAAMHVGVFVLVGLGQPLDDDARLLRRSGIVEIDKRLAVDLL